MRGLPSFCQNNTFSVKERADIEGGLFQLSQSEECNKGMFKNRISQFLCYTYKGKNIFLIFLIITGPGVSNGKEEGIGPETCRKCDMQIANVAKNVD